MDEAAREDPGGALPGAAPGSEQAVPAARPRRAIVVSNPISGRGQGAKAAAEIHEGLTRAGIASELHATKGRGDAYARLRSLGTELDLVVSVGGDGTLREVFEGLVDPATPVGVLPYGTANVLAAELGMPRDVHHALEILLAGRTSAIDVSLVNGRLSFLATGVGVDALAVADVEARRRGPIAKWSYLQAFLNVLPRYRRPELRVEIDGEPLAGTFGFVLVGNLRHYAGFVKLDRGARFDDGRLEVYLFPQGSRLELVRCLLRGVVSQLSGGVVRLERASRSVRIDADEPVPCQVDGDAAGTTPVELVLAPNQYRVVVP